MNIDRSKRYGIVKGYHEHTKHYPHRLALPDGEASSLIKNTGSGYCLNPGNTSQFCEVVNYLYNNPDQLNEFGKAGREASFQFTRESRANEMISVFDIAKTSGINKNDPHENMGL